MMQEKSAPFGACTNKEMTLDLLLTQDQGSSIVDGINHLRNLLLSIDLLLESLLSTLDSLLLYFYNTSGLRSFQDGMFHKKKR